MDVTFLLAVTGFCWLAIGFVLGTMATIHRTVNDEDLKEKLRELRKIRYQADKSHTVIHVMRMMERVNNNLMMDIFKQVDKELGNAIKNRKNDTPDRTGK